MNSNVNITDKTSKHLAPYKELAYGDFFIRKNALYRKIQPYFPGGDSFAISMLDGNLVSIHSDEMVKIVNVDIICKDLRN